MDHLVEHVGVEHVVGEAGVGEGRDEDDVGALAGGRPGARPASSERLPRDAAAPGVIRIAAWTGRRHEAVLHGSTGSVAEEPPRIV